MKEKNAEENKYKLSGSVLCHESVRTMSKVWSESADLQKLMLKLTVLVYFAQFFFPHLALRVPAEAVC